MKRYKLKRIVSSIECPWLKENVNKGSVVYEYFGYTYGCIGPGGIACTKKDGETPFFELPFDALEEMKEEKENV
jgi:hypothetical protein